MKTIRIPNFRESKVSICLVQKDSENRVLSLPEFLCGKETYTAVQPGQFGISIVTDMDIELQATLNDKLLVDVVLPSGEHHINKDMFDNPLLFASGLVGRSDEDRKRLNEEETEEQSADLVVVIGPTAASVIATMPLLAKQEKPTEDTRPLYMIPPQVLSYRLATMDQHSQNVAANLGRLKQTPFNSDEELVLDENGKVIRKEGQAIQRICNCAQ